MRMRGPLAWMAQNPVTANLIMIVCLVGGLIMSSRIKQEVFPEFSLDTVSVSVAYPGATPADVEQGIVLAVEDAISGVDGVKEVRSTASQGLAVITAEAVEGADVDRLYQDIKAEVDRIETWPEEAERPIVRIDSRKRQVMTLALYGDAPLPALRDLAETVRDELLQDPGITQVELSGVPDLEIAVEIPQNTLRRYGLTAVDVARVISTAAVDIPGGTLKTQGGNVILRLKDRRDFGQQFASLPIVTSADGAVVTLGEMAKITDGLEDADQFPSYNGKPAVLLNIYRVGEQTPVSVAEAVRRVAARVAPALPPGIQLSSRSDDSKVFRQRMELLIRNGAQGLLLVFVLLALFLEIRLAFWVSMGIPISFLGSFLLLPAMDISINMVSLFAFIITLGIVVDDAIVVGENIFQWRERGKGFLEAAILGVRQVAMPVVFSVLTNMAAFLPMFFVPGVMGKIFRVIPAVVLSVFTISLIESLFVLPAHLAHGKTAPRWLAPIHRAQEAFDRGFQRLVRRFFPPVLRAAISFRYATVAVAVAILMAVGGYVASGRMGMTMFPKVEADFAYVEFTLPVGTPVTETQRVARILEDAARAVAAEHGGERLLEGVFAQAGTTSGSHAGSLRAFLTDPEIRPIGTAEFTRLWRERAGRIPGIKAIRFEADRGGPGSGAALSIELSHRSLRVLEQASRELAQSLGRFAQVSDIDDGFAQGNPQFEVQLLPEGRRLGLTAQDVGRQLRGAVYGAEALRQQRSRNEVVVRVRLPKEERDTRELVDTFMVRTPQGTFVPLRAVATIRQSQADTTIERRQGRRVVTVTADVTPPSAAEAIVAAVQKDILPDILARYPGLTFSLEGKQADMRESVRALMTGLLLTVLGLFAMLAIPLNSYWKPLIIMMSIPFGLVGAILGHLLMGYSLSLVSLFGIVALSGVVINDSLVLVDTINEKRKLGIPVDQAIPDAALQRFRPVLLTTITTFGGLMPLIFETSRQARFLIPMAISLGFGVLFATAITLILVPCLTYVGEDFRRRFARDP
ncbi:MAG: acriflavin resistance protein [Desulfomicrobiaceae bacterium]|nr:acriflavin resistance protein [Desulfomicrobiaceae bacterium]